MLIRNGAYFNCIAGHNHSGVTSINNFINPMTMRGWFTPFQNDGLQSQIIRDSFPTGTNAPYSYVMGDKGALLTTTTTINGVGEIAGAMALGRACEASLSGSSTMEGNLSLVVQLACDLLGSTTLTASQSGLIQMASSLAGSGEITASLNLLASVVCSMTGSSTMAANLRGTLSLEADLTPFTELSPENLSAAVWNSLAASFNTAGTMGEKMNDAGSAANPWTEVIESGYTAEEILRLLSSVMLGKSSGHPLSPVYRDLNDTKDRVSGTLDSSGNRTDVTLDPD